jgi:hypothetical protein
MAPREGENFPAAQSLQTDKPVTGALFPEGHLWVKYLRFTTDTAAARGGLVERIMGPVCSNMYVFHDGMCDVVYIYHALVASCLLFNADKLAL